MKYARLAIVAATVGLCLGVSGLVLAVFSSSSQDQVVAEPVVAEEDWSRAAAIRCYENGGC